MKRMKAGQTAGAVAKELGLVEHTLRNWVKAFDARLRLAQEVLGGLDQHFA